MNNTIAIRTKKDYFTAVFWAAAVIILFWGVGGRSLYVAEGRWAEIVREMFIKHDFFHPAVNWEPYFDKPLLSYWLIALASFITGGLNEWALRLPSAIAGALSLWAVMDLGRRLWSRETGLVAGWILLTAYGMIFWSRTGVSDTENLAASILAVAWYWSKRDGLENMKGMDAFYISIVFYLICFIGAHTKGLTSVVIPMIAIAPDLLRRGRWKAIFTQGHILALMIGLAIYLSPFVYATITAKNYSENGLFMVFKENIQRFFEPFDHKEPFYVYFYYLPLLFMPWSPLLIAALAKTTASWKRLDEKTTWLITVFFLIFLFFTASGSRRSYYILPIFPFSALLVAVFLEKTGENGFKKTALLIQTWIVLAASFIEVLSPVILPILERFTGFYTPSAFKIATVLIGLMALLPLFLRRILPETLKSLTGIAPKTAAVLLSTAIIMGGLFCIQFNMLDNYRTERAFVEDVRQRLPNISQGSVAFYPKTITNLVFYLDMPGPIKILKDKNDVSAFLNGGNGDKLIITTQRYANELSGIIFGTSGAARGPDIRESVNPWETSKGKLMAKHVAWFIKGQRGK
ncbi:ArnT family glycosyltransferase [Dissulfurimicrobium hydrothermale]|uniref:ArnT family glycosyltransferase n=1 Tax=Dissulfurimicrobium hydrothermale TaxID=1750598 RepID=UPI001ED9E3AF|nr:glycosyltransferase family 39 protein [Dissulfurimicrobium hydrothermale]UKL13051.1 glycosyltransferase family 39 protein [Dissulfurimicrobium hydrothermale]